MTGFGKATAAFKTKKINVEIKSLNSKTLDNPNKITTFVIAKAFFRLMQNIAE